MFSSIEPQSRKSYKLILRLPPSVQSHLLNCKDQQQQQLSIDKITWHTLILRALGNQHGLIGKSVHFDLILATNILLTDNEKQKDDIRQDDDMIQENDEKQMEIQQIFNQDQVSVFVTIHEGDSSLFESAILCINAINLQDLNGFHIFDKTIGTHDIYATVDYENVSKSAMSKLKIKKIKKVNQKLSTADEPTR